MNFVDSHCHLTWPTFVGRVADVVRDAVDSGVIAIIDLGTDLESSKRAAHHSESFPEVYFGAGVHPNDASQAVDRDLAGIEELCRHQKCVAVGEIGLDFYRDHTAREQQFRWLRRQLHLARRIDKPVILHDRKASQELVRILDEENFNGIDGPGGVFHCFAGDRKMLEEVLARGFHVSFTGNITFKKSDRPDIAGAVPLERLLLETDSPFMAPAPKRGHENSPANIPYIAAALALIKGVGLAELAQTTLQNTVRLFHLPLGLP